MMSKEQCEAVYLLMKTREVVENSMGKEIVDAAVRHLCIPTQAASLHTAYGSTVPYSVEGQRDMSEYAAQEVL